MKRSTRRILFYGLVALFLVAGAAIVLYAQGWRFDVSSWKAEKIGAIFVRSYPDAASISLNGKPVENQSEFLSRGTLISELFPKTYSLRLTAPGYDTWQENANVLPSFVATFKYAVLVPRDASPASSGTVQSFFEAPGAIVTESDNTVSVNGTSVSKGTLLNATQNASSFIFKNWDGASYLHDAAGQPAYNLSLKLSENGIASSSVSEIMVDPYNPTIVVAAGLKKIWLMDTTRDTAMQIETAPPGITITPSLAISNSSLIAWTRKEASGNRSELMIYNELSETIVQTSTLSGTNEKLAWIGNNLLGVLQTNGSLALYNTQDGTLRELASDATDFSGTPDGTVVAALEHMSIEIFSLNDPSGYYRFNIPDIQAVRWLMWYKDDSHLFVVYPDHVSFLDLADLSLANFTTVASGTAPVYDPSENALYLISPDSHLLRYNFPE